MSPQPFTHAELPAGTRVYVTHEGYGTVVDHEESTGSVGVRIDSDGVVVSASIRQIESKLTAHEANVATLIDAIFEGEEDNV